VDLLRFDMGASSLLFPLLLLFCDQTLGQLATVVPVRYVTRQMQLPRAGQRFPFAVPLCGGSSYDGFNGTVTINLRQPLGGWNPTRGRFIYIKVLDDQQNVVCTNNVTLAYTCDFVYSQSMGDLTLMTHAPEVSGLGYTLSVDFYDGEVPAHLASAKFQTSEKVWSPHELPEPLARWLRHRDGDGSLVPTAIENLKQIASTFNSAVQTDEDVILQFNFCFPQTAPSVFIQVSVTAADSNSAFDSFVCTSNQFPCTQFQAKYTDGSGIAFNHVAFSLSRSLFGPLQLLVTGAGQFGNSNTFSTAAEIFEQA